jgi:hypothetical protein
MSIHLADAELSDASTPDQPIRDQPIRDQPIRGRTAPSSAQPVFDIIDTEEHERLTVARGIVGGMILSIPIWALIGFTIYMLL